MTLEQLGKEIQEFIKESLETVVELKKTQDELMKKVEEGMRGYAEVEIEIQEKKDAIFNRFSEKAKRLEEKLENVRELELKHIEETNDPVTADVVAELNLLSQLNLTLDDFKYYFEKYKRNPLAIRRLKEIADSKGFQKASVFVPRDRKEYLNVILGRMSNYISRFKNIDERTNEVKLKMIADGAIRGIDEDITAYRSL